MNIRETFSFIKQKLSDADIDDVNYDAIAIMQHVLNISRADITIYGDKAVSDSDFDTITKLADRRITGEPIQYIIGYWEFFSRRFNVADGVLIPRDDTEVLVRACIDLLSDKKELKVIDLCSGSGIIAATLQKELNNSEVYAVEKSDVAYSFLKENCDINNADVNTIHADLYACADSFEDSFFDLIVSNPPYIKSDEIAVLQREVQFEPKMALDGGVDGYDFYRGIVDTWSRKLKIGGIIAFEIGEGQFEYICDILTNHGFSDIKAYYDLGSTIRAVTAIYNS